MRNILLTTITALAITLSGCATNDRPQTPAEAERSAGLKALLDDINDKAAARREARIRAANEHNHSNRPLRCTPAVGTGNTRDMVCR